MHLRVFAVLVVAVAVVSASPLEEEEAPRSRARRSVSQPVFRDCGENPPPPPKSTHQTGNLEICFESMQTRLLNMFALRRRKRPSINVVNVVFAKIDERVFDVQ